MYQGETVFLHPRPITAPRAICLHHLICFAATVLCEIYKLSRVKFMFVMLSVARKLCKKILLLAKRFSGPVYGNQRPNNDPASECPILSFVGYCGPTIKRCCITRGGARKIQYAPFILHKLLKSQQLLSKNVRNGTFLLRVSRPKIWYMYTYLKHNMYILVCEDVYSVARPAKNYDFKNVDKQFQLSLHI